MYTDLIFDLYGTLVDIHTEESMEVWTKTALFFGYYGAHYAPKELKDAFEEQIRTRKATAGQSYECFPDIPFHAVMADLFRALGQHANNAVQAEENRVMQIDSYLMEHRFAPDCSCQNLACQMHLSTRQVQRLCQQYYNAGFRQVLTSMRMEVAAHRLLNSDISVSDVAQQVGYASVASFSAAYKRHFGRAPSQERSLENRT